MTMPVRDMLKEKGISPSYTRQKIYEFLAASTDHPTADDIYRALIRELPTLSKTTVYNVIKLLCEHDLVKPVNMSSSEMRYEVWHEPHSHFRCTVCGTIYDIPPIIPRYDAKRLEGFIIKDEEVNLSGICPICQQESTT